jgi:hypothetical protein
VDASAASHQLNQSPLSLTVLPQGSMIPQSMMHCPEAVKALLQGRPWLKNQATTFQGSIVYLL